MPLYARRQKSSFTPCPDGMWAGVCIDVVDKGMMPTDYGPKHKIQIRFLCDAEPKRADKKPYMVTGKWTLTMSKKGKLRPTLEIWRGKKFTDEEAYKFDIESLIGAQCQLQVSQEQGEEGPYAFVQAVFRSQKGVRVDMPTDYVREMDRPGYQPPEMPEEEVEEAQPEPQFNDVITDEDIPF